MRGKKRGAGGLRGVVGVRQTRENDGDGDSQAGRPLHTASRGGEGEERGTGCG